MTAASKSTQPLAWTLNSQHASDRSLSTKRSRRTTAPQGDAATTSRSPFSLRASHFQPAGRGVTGEFRRRQLRIRQLCAFCASECPKRSFLLVLCEPEGRDMLCRRHETRGMRHGLMALTAVLRDQRRDIASCSSCGVERFVLDEEAALSLRLSCHVM